MPASGLKLTCWCPPTFNNRIHLSLDENGIHNWETIDILAQSIYTKNYIVEGFPKLCATAMGGDSSEVGLEIS